MKKMLMPLLAAAIGLLLASCSSGSSTSAPKTGGPVIAASSDCAAYLKDTPGAVVKKTKDYVMVANFGHSEQMYSMQQNSALKPKTGEVMVSGQMTRFGGAGSGSMSMNHGKPMSPYTHVRHVEVHICSKSTGKAVAGTLPTMSLQDTSRSGSMMQPMQVAEMEGLDMKAADVHYGNNIEFIPGHHYVLRTTIMGQTNSFEFTSAK